MGKSGGGAVGLELFPSNSKENLGTKKRGEASGLFLRRYRKQSKVQENQIPVGLKVKGKETFSYPVELKLKRRKNRQILDVLSRGQGKSQKAIL